MLAKLLVPLITKITIEARSSLRGQIVVKGAGCQYPGVHSAATRDIGQHLFRCYPERGLKDQCTTGGVSWAELLCLRSSNTSGAMASMLRVMNQKVSTKATISA